MQRTEGVKKLVDLFAKYKKLTPPEGRVTTTFCEIVFDLYGFKVDKKQISYNPVTGTIHTRLPGPLKNELYLKKEELINHLKGRLGDKHAPKNII